MGKPKRATREKQSASQSNVEVVVETSAVTPSNEHEARMSWFVPISRELSGEWKRYDDGKFDDDGWARLQTSIGCGWVELRMHVRYWSNPYDRARNAQCTVGGWWGGLHEVEERLWRRTPEWHNPRRPVEAVAENVFHLRLTAEGLKLKQALNGLTDSQALDVLRKANRIAVGSINLEPAPGQAVVNVSQRITSRPVLPFGGGVPHDAPAVAKFNANARRMRIAASDAMRFLNYGADVPPAVVGFCMRYSTPPVVVGEVRGSCYVETLWNYLMRLWNALDAAGADKTPYIYDPLELNEAQIQQFAVALADKIGDPHSPEAALATIKHGARGEIDRALQQADCPDDAPELRHAVVLVIQYSERMLTAMRSVVDSANKPGPVGRPRTDKRNDDWLKEWRELGEPSFKSFAETKGVDRSTVSIAINDAKSREKTSPT